jgi:hypothetical protein
LLFGLLKSQKKKTEDTTWRQHAFLLAFLIYTLSYPRRLEFSKKPQ